MDEIQTGIRNTTVGTLQRTDESVWERTARDGTLPGGLLGPAALALQARTNGFIPVARHVKRIRREPQRPVWDVLGSRKDAAKGRRIENIRAYPTQPKPTWPNPTRPNPTPPNPAQRKSTEGSPAQRHPTHLVEGATPAIATAGIRAPLCSPHVLCKRALDPFPADLPTDPPTHPSTDPYTDPLTHPPGLSPDPCLDQGNPNPMQGNPNHPHRPRPKPAQPNPTQLTHFTWILKPWLPLPFRKINRTSPIPPLGVADLPGGFQSCDL